jgi:hypothetical protein
MTAASLRSDALNMLREARIEKCPGAYSATGRSRNNISILHQQARCINLSWALVRTGEVMNGSVVGIVGGGFSALTLAVSLAIQKRCIVYIYEKEERLLDRFRRSPYRYISTNLNARDLPVRFSPRNSKPIYNPPIFKWSEGTASEVAHRWLREFQTYYTRLPIFLQTASEVTALRHDKKQNKVELKVTTGKRPARWDPVDIAIVATGFGNEHNPFDIEDWSYWRSGSPLQYRPGQRKAKERVLLSGGGDSTIVELMHYVFLDFEHEHMPDYYPYGHGIESYVQPILEDSDAWSIRYSKEIGHFGGEVISELCWFYFSKSLRDRNRWLVRETSRGLTGVALKVHKLRECLLVRTWLQLRRHGVSAAAGSDELLLEREIAALAHADQFAIRDKLDRYIAELASFELAEKIGGIDLEKFVDLRGCRERLLGKFEIWMNDGSSSTIYSEKIVPVNLIFLKLCQTVEDIKFVPGRIKSIEVKNGYNVTFKSGASRRFERVATRFGLKQDDVSERLLGPAPRRLHFGDWLLELPTFTREIERNERFVVRRRFDAAYEAVSHASRRFLLSWPPPRHKKSVLPKQLYFGALMHPEPYQDHPILSAPEDWLRRRLKRGGSVTYDQSDGAAL